MSAKGVKALEAELGGPAPEGLRALSDDQLIAFSNALGEAKRRQSGALEAAVQESLEIVPRMVRGPVRKMLFG